MLEENRRTHLLISFNTKAIRFRMLKTLFSTLSGRLVFFPRRRPAPRIRIPPIPKLRFLSTQNCNNCRANQSEGRKNKHAYQAVKSLLLNRCEDKMLNIAKKYCRRRKQYNTRYHRLSSLSKNSRSFGRLRISETNRRESRRGVS